MALGEVAFHRSSFSLKRLFIKAALHWSGFSSKWLFIEVAFHWSSFTMKWLFIEAAFHRRSFSSNTHRGGFSSNLVKVAHSLYKWVNAHWHLIKSSHSLNRWMSHLWLDLIKAAWMKNCFDEKLLCPALSIKFATLSLNKGQHRSTQHRAPLCWVSRFIYWYPECRYAECRYAECRGATDGRSARWNLVEPSF